MKKTLIDIYKLPVVLFIGLPMAIYIVSKMDLIQMEMFDKDEWKEPLRKLFGKSIKIFGHMFCISVWVTLVLLIVK